MAARPPRAAASRHDTGTCSSTHVLTTAVTSAADDVRSSDSFATGRKIYVVQMPAITDEGVAQLRRRIGVSQPHPMSPHYLAPNEDAFRHVAEAYGDDNPLWCDPKYATKTRWGGVFADRAVHEWTAEVFAVSDGPVLSAQYRLMIRTDREKATDRKKYDDTPIEPYTDEQLAEIDAVYAGEQERRRGDVPRYWEDV